MQSWKNEVGLKAFELGIASPKDRVIIGGPDITDEELDYIGARIVELLTLICSLPARFFNNDKLTMALALGFDRPSAQILGEMSEPFSNLVFARADVGKLEKKWRVYELNIGSTVGGAFFASLPRLAGHKQSRDVLRRWAELTAQHWKLNANVAFIEDRRNIDCIKIPLGVLAAELGAATGTFVQILAHDELTFKNQRLYGPNGPIDFIFRFFNEKDILATPNAYRPILNALENGSLQTPMGLTSRLIGNKGILALLWSLSESGSLEPNEVKLVQELIPRTRRVSFDIKDEISRNRENLVMKPVDGFAGQGIICGPELSDDEWQQRIDEVFRKKVEQSYVVQEFSRPQTGMVRVINAQGQVSDEESQILWGVYAFGDEFLGAHYRAKPVGHSAIINQANGASIGPLPPS